MIGIVEKADGDYFVTHGSVKFEHLVDFDGMVGWEKQSH